MKQLTFLLLSVLIFATPLFAVKKAIYDQYEDVVILKDGSEIHGLIIEEKPNEYIKIQSGKNIFVFEFDEIELMKKELLNKKKSKNKTWSIAGVVGTNRSIGLLGITKDFKIVNQSAIASGVRRVEALRAEQLTNYLKKKKQDSDSLNKIAIDKIKSLKVEIKNLGEVPLNVKVLPDNEKIKKLNKQLEQITIKMILKDKSKNKISDKTIRGLKIRFQIVKGFPSKELKSLIDKGKKDLSEGIVVVYTIVDNKVGIAVGITNELIKKYDAVELVKLGSKLIGGTGGGGRKDFAQAGGNQPNNIDKSFQNILEKI